MATAGLRATAGLELGAAVEPHGVALDPAGNLYIADLANCRIREVGIGGTMTTIAGTGTPGYSGDGGPATSAAITFPAGVAVDRAGNVYITDFGNERVRKVTANGTIVTVAGNGTFGGSAGDGGVAVNAEFDYPRGVAVDTAGNLFFADEENNRIREMATDGTIATVAGSGSQGYSGDGGLAVAAALDDPSGVAVDAENNIYIADDGNGRIRKITPNGQITTVAGTGSFGFGGDGGPATKATFSGPIAVAVDLAGNLYIADAGNGRIRRVALDGTITTVAGTGADSGDLGDGGLAINARLSAPNGVAVDPAGNLYIADTGDSRIRRVATDGTITTVAGNGVTFAYSGDGGLAINASITYPFGVAVDAAANIYFPDIFWVRKVDANGIITTLAGGGASYSGDGGPAINAELWEPFGVAVDTAGDVYVADAATDSVRLLVPEGAHAALSIDITHQGSFKAGQAEAVYSIMVTNLLDAGPTNGATTVREIVPEGLSLRTIGGTGWNCGLETCTRNDALPGGASYPPITVMVGIDPRASCQVLNQATVFGGGSVAGLAAAI